MLLRERECFLRERLEANLSQENMELQVLNISESMTTDYDVAFQCYCNFGPRNIKALPFSTSHKVQLPIHYPKPKLGRLS